MVKNVLSEVNKIDISKLLEHLVGKNEKLNDLHIRSLMFGDYGKPDGNDKIYDEISDLDELSKVMEGFVGILFLLSRLENLILYFHKLFYILRYLDEYNAISKVPMNLVMFKFAIEHISRVSRILKQDNGHALLIGKSPLMIKSIL
jgi:dynein heavy chain